MASYLTCSATVNNPNFKYLFELILFTYHLICFFQLRIKQVCCSGVIYTKKPHHHCCEDSYLSLNNSSNPVCCNGKLVPSLPDHQCCGGYYVHVKTSEFQITLCSVFPLTSNLLFCFHGVCSSSCCSSVYFICPCLCRWILLSWPLAGPGLCGAGWQLLWGGSLLSDRRPALL